MTSESAAARAEEPEAPPPSQPRRRFKLPRVPKWIDSAFLVVGLALLVWVVSRYPLATIAQACRAVGPSVALVFLLPLGWHASGAAAVTVLLGRRIPWRKVFWARLAAEAYNSLFLAVGGEPFRVRFLSQFVPADEVVAALIRDRVLEMTSGYFVSAGFLFIGLHRYTLPAALSVSLTVYAVLTAALAVAGTALVVTQLPARVGGFILRALGGSATALGAAMPRRTVLKVLPFYIVSRALGVLEIGVLLHLLGGHFDLAQAGFFDGVLNAVGAISFFVPGGLGAFEGTSVLLFKLLGLGGAQGVVFGLVRRARMILISVAGVALHWLGRRALAPAAAAPSADSWSRALRRHAYTLWHAPRGIGRSPQAATEWDREYCDGKWRKLDSTEQLGHYALIAAYVHQLFAASPPSIVDVGCGHGRLHQLLRRHPYRSYVGLDLSAAAIAEAAQATTCDKTRFEVADFTTWTPPSRHDVIIFNESIYYARDPIAQLERYAAHLNDGGVLVLSIVQSSMNAGIARRIRSRFPTLHCSTVRNEHGETWQVTVISRDATAPAA
jgi:SAM-dependent methyltransferase